MKSYKDLPREVVLNAPDGAMWANAKTHAFYRFEDGHLSYFFEQRTWVKCTIGSLSSWLEHNPDIIPLPNVKIPWEATEDSVCPVPECFNIRVWVDGAKDHQFSLRDARHWRWNIRPGYVSITAYEIVDPDYMREESADSKSYIGLSPDVGTIQTKSAAEQGQLIRIRTDNHDLINKLQILSDVRERFPLIADCAKAAMERLVEKWVGK